MREISADPVVLRRLTGRMCASTNNAAIRWHWHAGVQPPASLLKKLGLEVRGQSELEPHPAPACFRSRVQNTPPGKQQTNKHFALYPHAALRMPPSTQPQDLLSKWPQEAVAPGALVGPLSAAAAEHLGLRSGTPVAQGGADAFIGMVGLGVVSPGKMALLTGSSHLHLGVAPAAMHGAGIWGTYENCVVCGQHVVEGGQTRRDRDENIDRPAGSHTQHSPPCCSDYPDGKIHGAPDTCASFAVPVLP